MASECLSQEQCDFFRERGYLVIRDALDLSETQELQEWAQEVHDWKPDLYSQYMPYEEINASGKRVLCRTENFVDYHAGFNSLLRGHKVLSMLGQLAGEGMLLFKEKINYKLAGSGGWAPHLDSTAYTHVKDIKHLTVLIAVDPTNMTNGGLEVVEGSHLIEVPINKDDNCIESSWVESNTWSPVELEAGEMLVFGSYLAHRSRANRSESNRRAIYATYNCAREGDLHTEYYVDRQKEWPATHKRKEGVDYELGVMRYAFGSPMLSVEMGRQLQV